MIKIPFKIAGATVGMGIAADAFGSEGLAAGGEAAGKFIAPAINISMGGHVIKQLKDLKGFKEEKGKKREKKRGLF